MIHSHNQAEHDSIMDVAMSIKQKVDDLYVNHHGNEEKLNNRIKLLMEDSVMLIDRLQSHVKNTQPMDDIYKSYQLMKKGGYWLLGALGTIVIALAINYLKLI